MSCLPISIYSQNSVSSDGVRKYSCCHGNRLLYRFLHFRTAMRFTKYLDEIIWVRYCLLGSSINCTVCRDTE